MGKACYGLGAMRLRWLPGLVLLSAAAVAAQTTQPPPAEALARDIQTKYDRINDFSADFVHSAGQLCPGRLEPGRCHPIRK